jgi:hypothetical protein
LRAREAAVPVKKGEQPVRFVTVKEFGDINISTLLSLLMLVGLFAVAKL